MVVLSVRVVAVVVIGVVLAVAREEVVVQVVVPVALMSVAAKSQWR